MYIEKITGVSKSTICNRQLKITVMDFITLRLAFVTLKIRRFKVTQMNLKLSLPWKLRVSCQPAWR